MLGLYHLTRRLEEAPSARAACSPRWPRRSWPTTWARSLQARIIRLRDVRRPKPPAASNSPRLAARSDGAPCCRDHPGPGSVQRALPTDYPYVNEQVTRSRLGDRQRPRRALPEDRGRRRRWTAEGLGFHWATRSGVTISIDDVVTPPRRRSHAGGVRGQGRKIDAKVAIGV
jgi:DNA-directed RNA polymerase subunit beta'